MRAAPLLSLASLLLTAQNIVFEKAPPEVDNALRARVSQFYQAHMDGKFRQAEPLVCEESKDFFYEMPKRRYLSFDITKIEYSESFTHAKVVTLAEIEWTDPRVGRIKVKPPIPTTWKVENGQWCWYQKQGPQEMETPFGTMKVDPTASPEAPRPVPVINPEQALRAIMSQVKADRSEAVFDPDRAATAAVTVTSNAPGQITLSVDPIPLPDLTARLDRTVLNGGESAQLTLAFQPTSSRLPEFQTVTVRVSPTGQVVPIRVRFRPAKR